MRQVGHVLAHGELAAASALVDVSNVDADAAPVTGSKDFSFMLDARHGGFIFIGNGDATNSLVYHVHTPGYDLNDDIIRLGVAYWVKLVETELRAA